MGSCRYGDEEAEGTYDNPNVGGDKPGYLLAENTTVYGDKPGYLLAENTTVYGDSGDAGGPSYLYASQNNESPYDMGSDGPDGSVR